MRRTFFVVTFLQLLMLHNCDRAVHEITPQCQCNLRHNDPYFSRVTDPSLESICPRSHPVVWPGDAVTTDSIASHSPYQLQPSQLSFYDKYGYIVLDSLFSSDEIEKLLSKIHDEYLPSMRNNTSLLITEESDNDIIKSVFEYHKHPLFTDLVRDPRIVTKVKQILGSEVSLFQSRINFQRALYGKGFTWHSDVETWHCEDGMPLPRALSVVIMLDNTQAYNGALMVIPGSHTSYVVTHGETPKKNWESSLKRQRVGSPSEQQLDCLVKRTQALLQQEPNVCQANETCHTQLAPPKHPIAYAEGKAGTVLLFDSNLMHASQNNISPLHRRNMFMVYSSVHNALQDKPYCAPNLRPEHLASRDPAWTVAI